MTGNAVAGIPGAEVYVEGDFAAEVLRWKFLWQWAEGDMTGGKWDAEIYQETDQ